MDTRAPQRCHALGAAPRVCARSSGGTGARALGGERKSRPGGFTFIELLIVLTIIALIFTFGAIKLSSGLPRYAIRTSAGNAGTTVEEMRLFAVSRGSWTGIRYHIDSEWGKSGWQTLPPASLEYPNEPIQERKPDALRKVEVGVRITAVSMRGSGELVESGTVDVYFSPTGTAGSHLVTFEASDGRLLTMSFNAITGTVDFFEGQDARFEDFEG